MTNIHTILAYSFMCMHFFLKHSTDADTRIHILPFEYTYATLSYDHLRETELASRLTKSSRTPHYPIKYPQIKKGAITFLPLFWSWIVILPSFSKSLWFYLYFMKKRENLPLLREQDLTVWNGLVKDEITLAYLPLFL